MGNIDSFGTSIKSKKPADEIFGISEVPSDGDTIDLNRNTDNAFNTLKTENPYQSDFYSKKAAKTI